MELSKQRISTLITGLLLAAAMLLMPSSRADAAWTVSGGGFGHGVGMSAYGAYGMAKHGWSHKKILRHYYRGTRIREIRRSHEVRVLLAIDPGTAWFSGVKRACGRGLAESRTYGARLRGSRVVLIRRGGKRLAGCGRRLVSEDDGRVSFRGLGRYRGGVVIVPSEAPGSLNVINKVGINAYVKGVIPNESIPSWPIKALRAQAVASRTFALSGGVNGRGFDLYNDTRSQVYGDIGTEYRRTSRAASQTSNQIVVYKGKPILTVFSASSGGHTENVENVWFGEPVPYLKGVPDPFDDVSPYHRWKYSFSKSDINGRLAAYVKGRLKRVKITRYGVSKRVIWARLYGTRGVSKIRGDSLQLALGLPDRLIFWIKRTSGQSLGASVAGGQSAAAVLPPGIGTALPMAAPSRAPATTSDG